MAETTLKIAREIAEAYSPKGGFIDRGELARLITEKLTPLVEAATVFEELIQESKGATMTPSLVRLLDLAQMNVRRELARIKGDNNGK